jgi:glycosyltransferase involved in cell wall biosynthesis
MKLEVAPPIRRSTILDGIVEREEHGMIVLSPAQARPFRRILHVNSYGGHYIWNRVKEGILPGHQLLGCIELARMGYEVVLAEPIQDFYFHRNPFPHDLRLLGMVRSWLRPDDILFCGHNVLYWLPFLRRFGAVRCHIVSLLYAREPLNQSRAHTGVIGLTRAGAEQAGKLAPQAKVANLGWGVDLNFFPRLSYNSEWFFSCGIANRDFRTLAAAAAKSSQPTRVISPGSLNGIEWPANVRLVDGGRGWLIDKTKAITPRDVVSDYFPYSAGTLIIMNNDPTEYTANGFTNLMEAMAMAQPVIMTRTGAVPGEIDIEKEGCGMFVPPENAEALAEAINFLGDNPDQAEAMGRKGRELVERYYNIERYARDLHRFFETL